MLKFAAFRDVLWQPIDAASLLREVEAWIETDLREHAEIRVVSELERPLLGNREMLRELFTALVYNAVEACAELDSRPGLITLHALEVAGAGVVQVIDNGPGIDQDDLKRVFDLFYTTRLSRNARGLGLPLAEEIITRLGGEITIESDPGNGTRVRVELGLWSDGDEERNG